MTQSLQLQFHARSTSPPVDPVNVPMEPPAVPPEPPAEARSVARVPPPAPAEALAVVPVAPPRRKREYGFDGYVDGKRVRTKASNGKAMTRGEIEDDSFDFKQGGTQFMHFHVRLHPGHLPRLGPAVCLPVFSTGNHQMHFNAGRNIFRSAGFWFCEWALISVQHSKSTTIPIPTQSNGRLR